MVTFSDCIVAVNFSHVRFSFHYLISPLPPGDDSLDSGGGGHWKQAVEDTHDWPAALVGNLN